MTTRNKYGRSGKDGLDGPRTAAFFKRYTYESNLDGQVFCGCRPLTPSMVRTLRRWVGGQKASQDTVNEYLLYCGISRNWFDKIA